jgi:hypothetical protein
MYIVHQPSEISTFSSHKEVTKQWKARFFLLFSLMMEGSIQIKTDPDPGGPKTHTDPDPQHCSLTVTKQVLFKFWLLVFET